MLRRRTGAKVHGQRDAEHLRRAGDDVHAAGKIGVDLKHEQRGREADLEQPPRLPLYFLPPIGYNRGRIISPGVSGEGSLRSAGSERPCTRVAPEFSWSRKTGTYKTSSNT